MKTITKTLGIILILASFLGADAIHAQRKSHQKNRGVKTHRTQDNKRSVEINHYGGNRYRTQPIHRNPHYRYPRHHRVIRTLPRHHVRLVYRGLPYFYSAGIYYTVYNDAYVVVLPPVGFRITVLPVGHTRVVLGSSVYFYHSGVYYSEISEPSSEEKYEITQPPLGAVITEIDKDAEQVVIDGKIFYDYNNTLYKKISTFDGNTAYEVVYVNKEEK